MIEAYSQTLEVVGPLTTNGFTERQIKDALWDAYYDVDSAVTQLVEEKSRREAKAEKDRLKQGKSPQKQQDADLSGLRWKENAGQKGLDRKRSTGSVNTTTFEPSNNVSDDADMVDEEALRSLHTLSLSSRREQIRRGRGMPGGKAQGLRGLAMGGRSGMAKRNLASLAPNHLTDRDSSAKPLFSLKDSSDSIASGPAKPVSKLAALAARSSAKRPAEQSSSTQAADLSSNARISRADAPSGNASGRPSKLAALAAARSAASPRPVPVSTRPATPETTEAPPSQPEAPAKPLSKLQQRMQASRQQRNAGPEAIAAAETEAAEQKARLIPTTCYGSQHEISDLFPMSKDLAQHQPGLLQHSAIAGSKQSEDRLVAAIAKSIPVPGGSPFDLFVSGKATAFSPQAAAVRKAFHGPSPDDVVLKAREGTTLAKR